MQSDLLTILTPSINENVEYCLNKLHSCSEAHLMWKNPLLVKSEAGKLSWTDYRVLFSQYYFYSKNFIRILSTMLVKCENDALNRKLIGNLWEEAGENDETRSHPKLFRLFLSRGLNMTSLKSIKQKKYTIDFVNSYIDLCLNSSAIECAAILTFATEGIVSRLYTIFKRGLLQLGVNEKNLVFFTTHIACDDEHAADLRSIFIYYANTSNYQNLSIDAINQAMCLRDNFLKNIYRDIFKQY